MNVYVLMDTGHDLFWIQCAPCDVCYEQKDPICDRTKSHSYTETGCDASLCLSLGRQAQSNNHAQRYCVYYYGYADGTGTSGLLAFETITFTSSNSAENRTAEVGFGCGVQNFNSLEGKGHRDGGVLGLGPDAFSLVSQLSPGGSPKVFAYSFGNVTDPTGMGCLVFGDEADLTGFTTPLVVDGFYYINLLAIGLGVVEPRLDINSTSFKRKPNGSGGVIMDTGGSALTIFVPEVYEAVKNAVLEQLAG